MSLASSGDGTLVELGSAASPPVFTPIAEVYEANIPQVQTDLIDVTHYQSPSGFEETIPGRKRLPSISMTMNFLPSHASQSAQTGVIKLQSDREIRPFRVTLPGGESVTFNGLVEQTTPSIPINDRMTLAVQIKPTGAPVWDLGA